MSLVKLREILDALDDVSCCSGVHTPPEKVAIALPDGDVGAADDPGFVKWLLAHGEPAPFGLDGETKVDKKVRAAKRLVARDKAVVHGFDPAALLDEIAATLSPTVKLAAELTDVLVYEKGGKFARHKDTPRTPDLIGTLVVGLPIAHTGGAFTVDDGRGKQVFDWGAAKPNGKKLPWVALFSDVDHEIAPVKSGARVTLVYALKLTTKPRADKAAAARGKTLAAAATLLAAQKAWPVMIVCGRHVIAEPEQKQPMAIATLRGTDREIAEAFVRAGYDVQVRACLAATPSVTMMEDAGMVEDDLEASTPTAGGFPRTQYLWSITRLKKMPPPSIIDSMEDEGLAQDIADYLLDQAQLATRCVVRNGAHATLVHETATWADGGYFGNEGYEAQLYTLAAIEIAGKAEAVTGKQPPSKSRKR